MPPVRYEIATELRQPVLAEILALIEHCTRVEGHRPVGEHKYAHLLGAPGGWTGVLARRADELVGYAHLRWNPAGDGPRLAAEVVVHPGEDRDEVARHLVEEVRALLARAGGGVLWLWVHRVQDAATTLAARMGFSIQRELAFMTRRLAAAPEWRVPDGVTVRPYRPGPDDAALLRVNNAAFAGHPENGGWTAATLEQRRSLDWFDPAGVLLAWRGERLLGFHWTKWHGHDSDEVPVHEPVGEVYVLAVDPVAHGTGLGRLLLRAGLAHLHGRGCRVAVLYVDAASGPALALYRSEGFVEEYREVCYEAVVPPEPAQPAVDLLRPA
ncbi:MAG TPA: mycothiol synthase [Egibacteraceae bacterium]|nr:mycothiol synthase [Egibacteraceae bacterium]